MRGASDPWFARVWQEFHAGNLTPLFRDVLLTMRTYCDHAGRCWPSHETLAGRARCSVRTVQRALQHAATLDLVSWTERRVRAGWRWLRTSNLYRLVMPGSPVTPGNGPIFWRRATTGQIARGAGNQSKKEALEAMKREAAELPDLLAARRAANEAAWAARYCMQNR